MDWLICDDRTKTKLAPLACREIVKNPNTFVSKIILHSYVLYYGEPRYVGIFFSKDSSNIYRFSHRNWFFLKLLYIVGNFVVGNKLKTNA